MIHMDIDPALIEYPLETAQRKVAKALDEMHDLPDAPICKVWNWALVGQPVQFIVGGPYMDHPKLGDGAELHSTSVIWLSRELGMARTRNTLYKLMGPERK